MGGLPCVPNQDPEIPNDPNRPVNVDDFIIERTIGKGTYGVVVIVRKKTASTERYAMKMQNTDRSTKKGQGNELTPSRALAAKREQEIMRNLHHPFIIRFAFFFELPNDRQFKDTASGQLVADSSGNNKFHEAIVMEFVSGGDLADYIFEHSQPSEEPSNREKEEEHPSGLLSDSAVDWICLMRRWCAEMCVGVNFLHSLTPAIIYRDLKPQNILLKPGKDGELHICFTDFGFSKVQGVATPSLSGRLTSLAGTPLYAAPEVMKIATTRQREEYQPSVDLYSLGKTLLVCLNRERFTDSPKEMKIPLQEEYKDDRRIPDAARRFAERLTAENPKLRGTSDTLMADPFFAELELASVSNRTLPAIDWKTLEQGV